MAASMSTLVFPPLFRGSFEIFGPILSTRLIVIPEGRLAAGAAPVRDGRFGGEIDDDTDVEGCS